MIDELTEKEPPKSKFPSKPSHINSLELRNSVPLVTDVSESLSSLSTLTTERRSSTATTSASITAFLKGQRKASHIICEANVLTGAVQ